ncbi:MAG TPA: glycosyltransferase family 4 protein [Bacteroidota bacterium]|nr:glycosyltransferase family 4 protein [Bacteroidota bacterium]
MGIKINIFNSHQSSSKKVWLVTEYYYPDEQATGYLMAKLSEGLCHEFPIGVFCRVAHRKGYNQCHYQIPENQIDIRRVWCLNFQKDILFFRILNILMLTIAIIIKMLFTVHRDDTVIAVTTPPTLPFISLFITLLKRAKLIVLVHDTYPEALIATGFLKQSDIIFKLFQSLTNILYHYAESIVVIGRDMKDRIITAYPRLNNKVIIIPNWVDVKEIVVMKRSEVGLLSQLGLQDKFVIGYLGTHGRTHDIELLIESAIALSGSKDIHFLFIGNGAKKKWLDDYIRKNHLLNITSLPYLSYRKQSEMHNACDISVITFRQQMIGVSVPSRMYNMMAAGKPILAITEKKSELAMVVEEEDIGWVITTHNVQDIVNCIIDIKNHSTILENMGKRARRVAVEKYSFEKVIENYKNLIYNHL